MSFFESIIVQDEIEQAKKLIKKFAELPIVINSSDNEIYSWINDMQNLLDKTKIFFVRLSLSDDRMAKTIKEKVNNYAKILGKNTFMEALEDVQMVIYDIKTQLDKQ